MKNGIEKNNRYKPDYFDKVKCSGLFEGQRHMVGWINRYTK